VDTSIWKDELVCLESIVDRLNIVVDPPPGGPINGGISTDQICEFLELLHPIINNNNSETPEERLRFLIIDSRPDIWTVLFNFAKRRDAFNAGIDSDSPRVRREVLRVICRLIVLCKSCGAGQPEGEGPPGLAGLCSQAVMNEDGVATLLSCLTTETDDAARSHCAEAIARLCEGSQMTMLSVMVQKGLAILITSLSRDSSPQVRRFCTLALGAFARGYSLDVVKEGGVQVLVERLSIDSSTAVRSLSAEILAHLLYNHRDATQEAVTRRGLAGILHARILEDSSCEVVESCLRLVELLTRLREGDFCAEFVRLGGAPAIMKRLRSPAPTAKLVLRTIRTLVECAPKSLEVGRRVVMHFQSLSSLMELALDDQGVEEGEVDMEPSVMYDEAQLKAELALTLGIICAHSVACRDHLATELGRLPMWAKSIRHRLLSALQDVSPNAFSDLMIYDEENVLLNSTEGWEGTNPKARAAAGLSNQRMRWELRQGAAEGEEAEIPDQVPEDAGAGWSMVGTNAALALTQEILRQSLEQALKCPEAQPKARKLTQAQKEALFARIATYIENHGGRLLEVFRRFDKDKSGAVDVAELERMLQSLGMTFTAPERVGLLRLFDINGDARVSYKEFLEVCNSHTPGAKGMGGKHSPGTSTSRGPSSSMASSTPRSTSQYQQYLSKMSTSDAGMATRRKTSPNSSQAPTQKNAQSKALTKNKSQRPSSSTVRPPAPTEQPEDTELEPKMAFSLQFVNVTAEKVEQMAKKSKRHCIQVKKELVILPANRRPRRAALLAASQKAEKYRQSWETLSKLIAAQGATMVQDTLAAMRATIITEDNLVPVVHELVNRFPAPMCDDEEQYQEGPGQAANSMGPLYTGSPAVTQGSPMAGSPMVMEDYGDESDSTDSEDDMGDLRLLGLA